MVGVANVHSPPRDLGSVSQNRLEVHDLSGDFKPRSLSLRRRIYVIKLEGKGKLILTGLQKR